MNAPWKLESSHPVFRSFTTDDASLDVFRILAAEFEWAPELCVLGSIRDAVHAVAVDSHPGILVVDLSGCADPLGEMAALAEVCDPETAVIAIGDVNDVRLYHDLTSSGVLTYLLKPIHPDLARDALIHAREFLLGSRDAGEKAAANKLTCAVLGSRGGVGVSTIATSLAWLLSDSAGQRTAMLDLDLHFGTGALMYDLEPSRGLTDAILDPDRIDSLFIERAAVKANDNLYVLAAETPINQALRAESGAFSYLLNDMQQTFSATVLDIPRHMAVNFPQVVKECNSIVLVTELTLAGARDTIRWIGWAKSQAPHVRLVIVANRVAQGSLEISHSDFERTIDARVEVIMPLDTRSAIHAAQAGRSIVAVNSQAPITNALRQLAGIVCTDTGIEDFDKADSGKFAFLTDIKAKLASHKLINHKNAAQTAKAEA